MTSGPTRRRPPENQTARGLHQGAVNDYWDRYARREAEARRIADSLDTKYADSVDAMKRIHCETEPTWNPPTKGKGHLTKPVKPGSPLTPPGSVDPPAHWDPSREWEPTEPRHHGPLDPHHPTDPTRPPGPTDAHDRFDPHVPSDPGDFDPITTGGVALGGGLGLAGLTSAIRERPSRVRSGGAEPWALAHPPLPAGVPAAGQAASAALESRSAEAPEPARPAAKRAGAARAVAALPGAGSPADAEVAPEDETTADRDLFDDGQDWIADDEGAAPRTRLSLRPGPR